MKKLFYFSAVLLVLSTTSCSLFKGSSSDTTYIHKEAQIRVSEPGVTTLTTPLVADIEVVSQKRIEPFVYNSTVKAADCKGNVKLVEQEKTFAIAAACMKYNADILVGQLISVDTDARTGCLVVTVVGYPAIYKNFRNATEKDMEIKRGAGAEVSPAKTNKKNNQSILGMFGKAE